MHSRRFFMQSTAAALSWAGFRPAFALDSPIQCLELSSERPCADISAFQCRSQSVFENHATMQLLANDVSSLTHTLNTESIDVVYGLGTGADEFIVEQVIATIAATVPFAKVLSGRHQYLADRFTHNLRGKQPLVDSLTTALKSAGPMWPSRLNVAMLAGVDRIDLHGELNRTIEKSIHAKINAPFDSPRSLHSWMFVHDTGT